jgi:hypothetical protein
MLTLLVRWMPALTGPGRCPQHIRRPVASIRWQPMR